MVPYPCCVCVLGGDWAYIVANTFAENEDEDEDEDVSTDFSSKAMYWHLIIREQFLLQQMRSIDVIGPVVAPSVRTGMGGVCLSLCCAMAAIVCVCVCVCVCVATGLLEPVLDYCFWQVGCLT